MTPTKTTKKRRKKLSLLDKQRNPRSSKQLRRTRAEVSLTQWAQAVKEEPRLPVGSALVGIPARKLVQKIKSSAVPLSASWVT